MRAHVVLGLCLAIVAICYANSISNDFIGDDHLLVALNPAIRTIQPAHFLLSPFWGEKNEDLGIYRPLVIFGFSIEYSIWQRWAPGFRLVNLLLHAINGFLVFLIVRSLLLSEPIALATAAVFLAHPVHTESVVAIVGQSGLLSTTFFLTAWLLFRNGRTALCCGVFLLSLLSKENAICFPAVIALDIWISSKSFKKVVLEWKRFVAVGITAIAYIGLRLWVIGGAGVPQMAQYTNGRWTLLERELTSARAFMKYFQLLLAPVDVTGNYDFISIPVAVAGDWDAWLALLLVVASMVFALWITRRSTGIAFAVLFFYVAMLPMSNWIVPTSVVMAERFLYVPSIGFALLIGIGWAKIPAPGARRLLAGGALTIMIILCMSHNYVWKNELTYYGNMVRVFPGNARGRQGYGVALLKSNRAVEARDQFEAGLRIHRNTPLLAGMSGAVIQLDGSCARAHPLLDEALQIQPRDYVARWLLAECLDHEGQTGLAEQTYRQAVEDAQFPDSQLLIAWAGSLERTGQQSEAVTVYSRAAAIDPGNAALQERLSTLPGH